MKTLLIIFTVLFSYQLFSQDSIITRSGQVIPAKVNEVTQTEVKYRKPSNPDGPVYVISKSEVVVIEYRNGTKDVFQSDDNSNNSSTNNNNTNSLQAQQQQSYYNSAPAPRPSVNVVVAPPLVVGPPMIGFGGFYGGGFYRPYPRFYGGYGYGGYGYHGGYGGYHGGGYYHPHWHH